MNKRRVIQLVLLLIAGAIVNVAVAWGCALWVDPTDQWYPARQWGGELGEMDWLLEQRGISRPYKDWNVELHERRGGTRAVSSWRDADTEIGGFSGIVPEGSAEELVPKWGTFIVPPSDPRTKGTKHVRIVEAWGWPALSMFTNWAGSGPFPGNCVAQLVTGIKVSSVSRIGIFGTYQARRALPLLPLWPGFAINTIFYAASLAGLFALRQLLPSALRRRRIKRGQCPACAYPIGTSLVCTECGAAIDGNSTRRV